MFDQHAILLTYNFQLNSCIACRTFVKVHTASVQTRVCISNGLDVQRWWFSGCLEKSTFAQCLIIHPMWSFLEFRWARIETMRTKISLSDKFCSLKRAAGSKSKMPFTYKLVCYSHLCTIWLEWFCLPPLVESHCMVIDQHDPVQLPPGTMTLNIW